LSESLVQMFLDYWTEFGEYICERFCEISNSGIPTLLDVNWTIRLDMARKKIPKMSEAKLILELLTDQGLKIYEMPREELIKLRDVVNEIQKHVDLLVFDTLLH
uniref:COMM domain-containing protein n=1 Tax=Dracunculus medinensis TaxID=318479 RepID=A0A0N4UM59_DRAME